MMQVSMPASLFDPEATAAAAGAVSALAEASAGAIV
jgi:hypothetical protein